MIDSNSIGIPAIRSIAPLGERGKPSLNQPEQSFQSLREHVIEHFKLGRLYAITFCLCSMASYVYLSNKQELTYAHAIVEIGTIPIEESNTNLPEPRALINKRLVNILLSSNSVLKPVVEQSSGDDLSIASLRKRITVSTVHPSVSYTHLTLPTNREV